jgi:predicted amidohydrolase
MWKDHLVRLAAEPLDGPIVRTMAGFARWFGVAVGFGMAERSGRSAITKPYNSYVLLDRLGEMVGVYRKNYVTVLERDYLRKDTRRPVFWLGGLRVAVGICADCARDELLDSYGRRGAELVLMPHAWDADPILTNGRIAAWRSVSHMVEANLAGRVRRYRTHDEMFAAFSKRIMAAAGRNRYYAAFVNQAGRPHPLIPFVGPTFVVKPCGQVVARSRSEAETIVIADILGEDT